MAKKRGAASDKSGGRVVRTLVYGTKGSGFESWSSRRLFFSSPEKFLSFLAG